MSTSCTSTSPPALDRHQLEKLASAIRGKLQFMDYLVRAAVADADRYAAEPDPGTRSFLRQLVEMHASSLAVEAESMRLVDELGSALEAALSGDDPSETTGFPQGGGR